MPFASLETEAICNTAFGDCHADHQNYRAGYRDSGLESRADMVELRIPKPQRGSYFPVFLEDRRTAEKALTAVIQKHIQGISTPSVDDLVKAMGMEGISKSQVSSLCVEINECVKAVFTRPHEDDGPYVWIEATYIKVRRDHRIASAAVNVTVGFNSGGLRKTGG